MWPKLIAKAKQGGLNTIDTYVFWNGHEPVPGQAIVLLTLWKALIEITHPSIFNFWRTYLIIYISYHQLTSFKILFFICFILLIFNSKLILHENLRKRMLQNCKILNQVFEEPASKVGWKIWWPGSIVVMQLWARHSVKILCWSTITLLW